MGAETLVETAREVPDPDAVRLSLLVCPSIVPHPPALNQGSVVISIFCLAIASIIRVLASAFLCSLPQVNPATFSSAAPVSFQFPPPWSIYVWFINLSSFSPVHSSFCCFSVHPSAFETKLLSSCQVVNSLVPELSQGAADQDNQNSLSCATAIPSAKGLLAPGKLLLYLCLFFSRHHIIASLVLIRFGCLGN